jgi:hypothetical protein
MSVGEPTQLVRDSGVESYDPVADEPLRVPRVTPVSASAAQERPPPPANSVTVTVRAPIAKATSVSRHRNRLNFVLIRAFVVLIVGALAAGLVLGAGGAAVVIVIGIVIIAGVLWAAVRSQANGTIGSYHPVWMSRTVFYEGPFGDKGIPGSADFEKYHSVYGLTKMPPRVRLGITSKGIEIEPADNTGTSLNLSFSDLQSVELDPGPGPKKLLVTPATADQLGSAVLTTATGRIARFSGIPSEGLKSALIQQGATVKQQNEAIEG